MTDNRNFSNISNNSNNSDNSNTVKTNATFEHLSGESPEDWRRLAEGANALAARLSEDANSKGYGEALASAMQDFYRIYGGGLGRWFASLFDTRVGGFYYSASARDNETLDYKGEIFGLLPDSDSTCQAMWTLVTLGIAKKSCRELFPERMKRDIIRFLKGLEEEDGYVYHPQFPRERNIEKVARRSRDTSRAGSALAILGASFTYDTPLGHKGDGIDKDGNPVALAARSAVAVASELSGKQATEARTARAEYLEDRDTFTRYLSTLKLRNNSYSTGSFFITQYSEIKERDRQLGEDNPRGGLVRALIEWLSENQLENGTWNDEINYATVSGIMKICRLYSAAGVMMPRVERTLDAVARVILSDIEPGSITDVFNPWIALEVIVSDLYALGGENEAALGDRLRLEILKSAPEMIAKTKRKLGAFLRSDGAFSYNYGKSGGYNMGMPLGIAGIDEGDMNATHLAAGIPAAIYRAMGLSDLAVPILGESEREIFLRIIDEKYRKTDKETE